MKAIICDKCNSINNPEDTKYVRVSKMNSITTFNDSTTKGYEICEKCYDEIFSWVKSRK